LVSPRCQVEKANPVAEAIDKLQRHSCYGVICWQCENDDEGRFQVIDVDDDGSITEVKCEICQETSYVCRCECSCQKLPTPNGLEHSYKEKLRNCTVKQSRKSICICNVMESTVALLRRNNLGHAVCLCCNDDPDALEVTDVDRLGFITSVQCRVCPTEKPLRPKLSPLEESYAVQILYHRQSDRALEDHGAHVDELCERIDELCERVDGLCDLLQRHSPFDNSICPECDSNDRKCCRVTAIESGKVTEVEFFLENERPQRLQITCHSCCYYRQDDQYTPRSKFESTYKELVRSLLQDVAGEPERREQASEVDSEEVVRRFLQDTAGETGKQTSEIRSEAILSCTVLAANAAILRRHSIDNKLCQHCKNDDHDFLEVTEIDRRGFITGVRCIRCVDRSMSMSTICYSSRCYYVEIDESMPLERGDHIVSHRTLGYWDYAIVTRTDGRRVTVVQPDRSGCAVTFHESTKTRQDMSTSFLSGTAYRITYDDCYTNEYTALRAEKSVGEQQCNFLSRNSEHFSHWCKTGLTTSDQMTTCFSSVAKTMLAFGLRILSMLLLAIFQMIHESRKSIQTDRKRFEHIITSAYMLLVFLLFSVWSMYRVGQKKVDHF